MKLFAKTGPYEGPRCFIPFNYKGLDGTYLEGGWHYSTRMTRKWGEIPHRKLHLNDEDPNEANWFYEYAEKGHKSWVEKHGPGNQVSLGGV